MNRPCPTAGIGCVRVGIRRVNRVAGFAVSISGKGESGAANRVRCVNDSLPSGRLEGRFGPFWVNLPVFVRCTAATTLSKRHTPPKRPPPDARTATSQLNAKGASVWFGSATPGTRIVVIARSGQFFRGHTRAGSFTGNWGNPSFHLAKRVAGRLEREDTWSLPLFDWRSG